MDPNNIPINLLWTGGWDSTFRLLQILVDYKQKVQPYYIIDTGRGSTLKEIDARYAIIKTIQNRYPQTKDLLLPTKYFALADIRKNETITEKFKILKSELHIGAQYDWLSRFAEQYEIQGLELSIEKSDRNTHFKDTSIFIPLEGISSGSLYKVKSDLCDSHPKSIFKPFHFPILDFTKIDMRAHSIKMGYDDILDDSWFCFTPIDGKPCGLCNPCKNVVVEGMGHRLPRKALIRNKYYKAYEALAKVEKIARRQVRKLSSTHHSS
ncbi:MAG TPA: hypothetical protein VK921_00960 [Anditalea sp.]|nr:hypothetical protein [Anditalea sp.]